MFSGHVIRAERAGDKNVAKEKEGLLVNRFEGELRRTQRELKFYLMFYVSRAHYVFRLCSKQH